MKQALRFLIYSAMLAAVPMLHAQAARPGYHPPRLDPPAFDIKKVTMLESEMREYSENLVAVACEDLLAAYANGEGVLGEVPPHTWLKVRKLMGVAMSLSPRARIPVVANARLKENRLPGPARNRVAADAFCSLLLARAQVLRDTKTPDNTLLASYFLELSTMIDPENEDAIYQLEIHRMDGNQIDWSPILGHGE